METLLFDTESPKVGLASHRVVGSLHTSVLSWYKSDVAVLHFAPVIMHVSNRRPPHVLRHQCGFHHTSSPSFEHQRLLLHREDSSVPLNLLGSSPCIDRQLASPDAAQYGSGNSADHYHGRSTRLQQGERTQSPSSSGIAIPMYLLFPGRHRCPTICTCTCVGHCAQDVSALDVHYHSIVRPVDGTRLNR